MPTPLSGVKGKTVDCPRHQRQLRVSVGIIFLDHWDEPAAVLIHRSLRPLFLDLAIVVQVLNVRSY